MLAMAMRRFYYRAIKERAVRFAFEHEITEETV